MPLNSIKILELPPFELTIKSEPRRHLCPGHHLIVLKKYIYKNKKERKKENKEVLPINTTTNIC